MYKLGFSILALIFSLQLHYLNAQNNEVSVDTTQNIASDSTTILNEVDSTAAVEIENYKQEVRYLVSFLEHSLNLLGDPETSAQDKDVIIHESFLKAFKSDKVQIEDDLDENRDVITNKNIQSYLKDVDFFFKSVKFTFDIENVEHFFTEDEKMYFKVTLNRNLKGVSIDGDSLNLNKQRYIEVNLNREDKDLKIASIYTTKMSEEEELAHWWNEMTIEWKRYFAKDIHVKDTLTMNHILDISDTLKVFDQVVLSEGDTFEINAPTIFSSLKKIVSLEELDISGNKDLPDLKPLAKMISLKKLNLSGTKATDLSPLRNLTKIEGLYLEETSVTSLATLKYAINIKDLVIDKSQITDLSPVANFTKLEKLYFNNSGVKNIDALSGLVELNDLRFSNSKVTDLKPIANLNKLVFLKGSNTKITNLGAVKALTNLESIEIKNTGVNNLGPLSKLQKLRILFVDNTKVSSLKPLESLNSLKNIYCDNSQVKRKEVSRFNSVKPETLVVFESAALQAWWKDMSKAWQEIFKTEGNLKGKPSKEKLQVLSEIDEINVAGNKSIRSLQPLKTLINLKTLDCSNSGVLSLDGINELLEIYKLDCSNTGIKSIEPLSRLTNLEELNLKGTQVKNLEPLSNASNLETLNCEGTQIISFIPLEKATALKVIYADGSKVNTLSGLEKLPSLSKVYCDNTGVNITTANKFYNVNNQVLVIFNTKNINVWWSKQSVEWKKIFGSFVTLDEKPGREQLHKLTKIEKVEIEGNKKIRTLAPLQGLFRLKELKFTDTSISSLIPLIKIKSLEVLQFPRNPVSDLSPLNQLVNLRELAFQSTPVNTLEKLEGFKKLKVLKCSATPIRSLRPLETLSNLEHLECFNTAIRSLRPIEKLSKMKVLKCYTTKIPSKKVDYYKKGHPKVDVTYY